MKKWYFLVCFTFLSLSQVFSQCSPSFTYQADTNNFVVFTNQSTASSVFYYRWDFGDGSPIDTTYSPSHQYSNSGSYVVSLSIDSGTTSCGTFVDTVFVNYCNAYFTKLVTNKVVQFQNYSAASSSSHYYWHFGDGNYSPQKNPTHTYQFAGQYAVKLDVYDSLSGCFSTFIDSVTVNAPPCQAGFNSTTNKDSLFIQNQASNYQLISYDFGDSTTSTTENPTHIYSQSGAYLVCQTVRDTLNNCTDTFCDTIFITIPPPCQAGFNFTTNKDSLFIQNQASNYQLISYDFGDSSTSTAENPTHIYSQSGTYLVCQTVTDSLNNCTDTFCDTIFITIPPPCQAGFNFTTNKDSLFIQNQASSYQLISYDFGDSTTSTTENPTHIYSQSGAYLVCQTVRDTLNNCTDTFCDTIHITIPPACQAGFTYTINEDSLFVQNTAANYQLLDYDYGDGNTSSVQNPIHIYAQSGSYQVCQTVEDTLNNCLDVFCDTVSIVIPPSCQAGFTYQFQGDSTYFQNTAINYDSLIYFFGDGDSSTSANPVHKYYNSGEYVVEQKVFNHRSCSSTYRDTIQVTISTSCVAKFELALDTTKPSTLFLVNKSSNDNSNQYFWDFGDGNTSSEKNPTHQYAENKPYPICLTVSDTIMNCMSIYCDTVGIDSNGNILKSPGFTLKVIDGSAIGIRENKNELTALVVYPNPANNFIKLKWPPNVGEMEFQLISSQGQLLKSDRIYKKQGDLSIRLHSIDPGLYWLIFTSNENRVVRKIIKQ